MQIVQWPQLGSVALMRRCLLGPSSTNSKPAVPWRRTGFHVLSASKVLHAGRTAAAGPECSAVACGAAGAGETATAVPAEATPPPTAAHASRPISTGARSVLQFELQHYRGTQDVEDALSDILQQDGCVKGEVSSSCNITSQQMIRSRLRRMQHKKQLLQSQQHRHNRQQQRQQPFHVKSEPANIAAGSLGDVISHHQQQHVQSSQNTPPATVPTAASDWLDRKLTSILSDCTCWQDVADTLATAESTGRLNNVHVAAAAATLARLHAASQAAAAAASNLQGVVASAVVPATKQQSCRMRVVRQAAAAAAATGWHSRWHMRSSQPGAAAAGACAGGSSSGCGDLENQTSNAQQPQQQLGLHHNMSDDVMDAGTVPGRVWSNGQSHLLGQLCLAVGQYWQGMSAASMTSCCWSLACLGQALPEQILPAVGAALLEMAKQLQQPELCESSATSSHGSSGDGQMKGRAVSELPRQLVVLLWALAKMSIEPKDLQPRQLQQQHQHDTRHQQLGLQTTSQFVDSSSVVGAVFQALLPHLPSLTGQGVTMLLWALATWRIHLPSQDAAVALLQASSGALLPERSEVNPAGLARQLWSLARLGVYPTTDWLAAWLAAMWAALPAASSHDCAIAAWGLATLNVEPPGHWLSALCNRAAGQAAHFGACELPVLLWALAKLRFRPSLAVAQALLLRGHQLSAQGALSPQGLALMMWAPASLGLSPRAAWLDGLLGSAAAYLPLFRPVEASALMVGLARLQHIPHALWMEAWWEDTLGLLQAASGQQLVLLLWAAVQLGQAPPSPWFAAWQSATAQAMATGQLSGQGYGIMWGALQQLEVGVQPEWLQVYWQASCEAHVSAGMDCLAAERTLAGLSGLLAQSAEAVAPPRQWAASFLATTYSHMHAANVQNIAGMLAAAGQLELPLPRRWLDAAMNRLAALLEAQGIISSSSSNSTLSRVRGHLSLTLVARLQRRRVAGQLRQVLAGLRAQQMMAAAAAATLGHRQRHPVGSATERPSSGRSSVVAVGVVDAVSAWPWLEEAVMVTWPDRQAAQQALRALTGKDS